MATASNMDARANLKIPHRGSNMDLEDKFQRELESLLQQRHSLQMIGRDRDHNVHRSGSAPPTVNGLLRAMDSQYLISDPTDARDIASSSNGIGLLSDDELRWHPAYLSYYYSSEHSNPRLPPPLLSKEDWRVAQRFQNCESLFDNSSLFSIQPGIPAAQAENDLMELRSAAMAQRRAQKMAVQRHDQSTEGIIGLSASSRLGPRRKSFADILQEGLDRDAAFSNQLSRPASCNAFRDTIDSALMSNFNLEGLHKGLDSYEAFNSRASPNTIGVQSNPTAMSAPTLSSPVPRNRTPESHGRASASGLPPIGTRVSPIEKKNTLQNCDSYTAAEVLSRLNVSEVESDNQPDIMLNISHGQESINPAIYANYGGLMSGYGSIMSSHGQVNIPKRTSSSANLYSNSDHSRLGSMRLSEINIEYEHSNVAGEFSQASPYFVNNHSNSLPENYLSEGSRDRRNMNKVVNQAASDYLSPHRSLPRNNVMNSHCDSGNEYLAMLLALNRQQSGDLNALTPRLFENPSHNLTNMYTGNHLPAASKNSRNFQNMRAPQFTSMMKLPFGGLHGSTTHVDIGCITEAGYAPSLLDEIKNNKARSLEFSEIFGHVIAFSMDQYGSRFIQQKLETATEEEKNAIFPEIIPYARTLMTDVFGNYVIQKFFEHGTRSHRKELASQITGYVLPLSLQMYGCRVIQKALEVVDVDQQAQLVEELDGSVLKCVHDQNGNHVIQKCIECVPQHQIQFIISAFYGQVVTLSTHPYGCRVIQRVLEHINDGETQKIIMDEIMQSVCALAQDQYGNYVIQHIIQHGKPHERSDIINKLAGQIVKMSQQKFASNVVEKCLTFGGPKERQILVNEMLGATDDNEPLQAMMKDPYGNYVVQKVLETCNDRDLELILSRIKVHLNALKRYTYGKHIVGRVEKLITTGERRIGLASSLAHPSN